MVTGIDGECGKINRIGESCANFNSGKIASKSCPLEPHPCNQITLAVAGTFGSTSTQDKYSTFVSLHSFYKLNAHMLPYYIADLTARDNRIAADVGSAVGSSKK